MYCIIKSIALYMFRLLIVTIFKDVFFEEYITQNDKIV
jgi:hypothetical protein